MSRAHKLSFGLALAATVCTAPAIAATLPTPGQISRQIETQGARATVGTYYASRQWELIMAQVSTGKQAWLDLVPKLQPGTDAGTAEDLAIVLAEALPHNPAGVLRLVVEEDVHTLSLRQVCSIPFIEPTKARVAAYRKRATAALNRLHDPGLVDRKAHCLAALG